jgi:hypothetical protein
MTRQALRLKMEKIIEGWKESGLPKKDWCERKKITYVSHRSGTVLDNALK